MRLCWSVTGWLSIENCVCAWSPTGWKKPFESATTPGEASVTTWFRPAVVSTGSFAIRLWSMSVCAVGSRSTSSIDPTTFTDVLKAVVSVRLPRSMGTEVRTSTFFSMVLKPCRLACTR